MRYPIDGALNGVNSYLFPYSVNRQVFETWFPLTLWGGLTSQDMSKPVYLHNIKAGEGLRFTVGKLNSLDYLNPVMDTAQKRGAAQTQSMDSCSIDTSRYSWPVMIRDQDLMTQGTPTESLPSLVTSQLVDVQSRNFSDCLLRAATVGRYAQAGQVNGAMPNTNRAVAGNLVDGQAADGVWSYDGGAHMNARLVASIPTARAAQHRLSLAHLRRLKKLALLGGNTLNIEDPIRPSMIKTVSGQNSTEYYYFAPLGAIDYLLQDADFKAQMINRINIESAPQPISGADYIGKYDGINIYSCPMLDGFKASVDAEGDGLAYWGILMGAGAFSLGWYKYPQIVMDTDLIENSVIYCSHEQRGQDILRFKARSAATAGAYLAGYDTVEYGIVHSFTRV